MIMSWVEMKAQPIRIGEMPIAMLTGQLRAQNTYVFKMEKSQIYDFSFCFKKLRPEGQIKSKVGKERK